MAVFYVAHNGSGADDGTSPTHTSGTTGPWTFGQMLSATPNAGDEIRVMATGTYTRSATGTVAYANGTSSANILITGANGSGTVDGTRPTIQASAGSITLLSLTNNHITARRLIVDGNSQSSTTGFTLGASYTRGSQIKAMNCTVKGLNCADDNNSTWLERCEATGCSGTASIFIGNSGRARFCEAYNNTTHGFQMNANSFASYCLSYYNTGGSSDCFNCSSVGYQADHCVALGAGRHGFDLTGNSGYGSFLTNCLSQANNGEGYGTDGAKAAVWLFYCGGYNNTSGNYNASNIPTDQVVSFVNGSADFFVDIVTGNLALNTTAGGGAAARAAGFPWAMPHGLSTGYTDVGAIQHQDPAGGGGGVGIIGG